MIILKIQGGLGNQMFQYAAGRNLSIRLNTESVFSNGTFILTFCHVIFCALIFKEIRDKISRYVFFISMIYGKHLI